MRVLDLRSAPARWLDHLDHNPDGAAARLLTPLGAMWEAVARRRRASRARPALAWPRILAVGNLRVGGTGKTPVVRDLAERMIDAGHAVAVVTRGYRAESGGDEPAWLGEGGVPVVVDRDRAHGARRARDEHSADWVLLDDGLQGTFVPHYAMGLVLDRDLARPPRCLPAGPAREGSTALDGLDVLCVRREAENDLALPEGAIGFRLVPTEWVDPEGRPRPLREEGPGTRVGIVTGLARALSFERDVLRILPTAVASCRFDDHFDPGPSDLHRLRDWIAGERLDTLVVPEKNLARMQGVGVGVPVWSLRSTLRWDRDPLEELSRIGLG